MIWLGWRQQRMETLIAAGLLAVLAAALVPAGIHAADSFAQQHVARCIDRQTEACSLVVGNWANSGGFVRSLVAGGWLNLIPGLIGVALATPLLLDLENGTTRLAWTQSVTRRHWIATKLGLAIGTVLAAAAAFSLIFTWYQRPFDRIWGRWDQFGFEGIAPLAYALFALGLALAVGVLLRRGAAALVVAFGAYVAARLFVQSWLRQRLVPPVNQIVSAFRRAPNLERDWVIYAQPSDARGHSPGQNLYGLCARSQGPGSKGIDPHCLARHGAGYSHLVYQPASRFWEFQGIETALFAGVAVLLIAFASWRILRTD